MAECGVVSAEPEFSGRAKRGPEQEAAAQTVRASGIPPRGVGARHPLLALQRSAGNAAVASMLAGRGSPARSVDAAAEAVDRNASERSADALTESGQIAVTILGSPNGLPPADPGSGRRTEPEPPHIGRGFGSFSGPIARPAEIVSAPQGVATGEPAGGEFSQNQLPAIDTHAFDGDSARPSGADLSDPGVDSAGGSGIDDHCSAVVQRFELSDLPGAGLVKSGAAIITGAASTVGDLAGAALDLVRGKIASLTNSLRSGWTALQSTAGKLVSGLGEAARGGVEAVSRVGSSISSTISSGYAKATSSMGTLSAGFTSTMSRGLETVKGAAGALGRALSTMDADGLRAAYGSIKGSVGRVFGNLTAAANAISARGRAIWDGLAGQFNSGLTSLGAMASGLANRLQTAAAGALAQVTGQWERLRGAAANMNGIGGTLARAAAAVIERLLAGLRSLWDGITAAWSSVQRSVAAISARVTEQLSAARDAIEKQARSMFDRLRAQWQAVTEKAAALTRNALGVVGSFVGRIASFNLDKTITQISAISKFLKRVSSARDEAEAALDRRAAQIAGMIEARMPDAAREQLLQHAPDGAGASASPPSGPRGPVLQRAPDTEAGTRSSLSLSNTFSRVYQKSKDKWEQLTVKKVVTDMLWTMLWPWTAVGHEFTAIWDDWKSAASRLFAPRGSSVGTFVQDLWTDLLALVDFPYSVVRHVVNMVGALWGWVTIILAGGGAILGGLIGSIFPILGTGVGALAGGAAGLALAGAGGEIVLAAFVATQIAQLVKLLVELFSSNLTAAAQDENVEKASDSAIGLAIAAIVAAIVWIAGELAGAFLDTVRKLRGKPTEDTPPAPPNKAPDEKVEPAVVAGKAKLVSDIKGSQTFADAIAEQLSKVERPGAKPVLEARLRELQARLTRLAAEGDAAKTPEEVARIRAERETAQKELQQLNKDVRASISRFPDSWNDYDPGFHEEFEAKLKEFRGNDDLEPTPGFRGGEGQLFLSGKSPLLALKRWFKTRVGDMAESLRLLRSAKSGVEGNGRLSKVVDVVEVAEKGSDWAVRGFDPTSVPLRNALGDPTVAAARAEALSALEGATDPALVSLRGKLESNSANLHWSPAKGKILVIDMQ